MIYEPVHELIDYHDGPRIGTADFQGRAHRFVAIAWGDQGPKPGWTVDEDRFELTPVAEAESKPVLARATFRAVSGSPKAGPGVDPTLEVYWQPLIEESSP